MEKKKEAEFKIDYYKDHVKVLKEGCVLSVIATLGAIAVIYSLPYIFSFLHSIK